MAWTQINSPTSRRALVSRLRESVAVAMRAEGYSYNMIARELGICRQGARQMCIRVLAREAGESAAPAPGVGKAVAGDRVGRVLDDDQAVLADDGAAKAFRRMARETSRAYAAEAKVAAAERPLPRGMVPTSRAYRDRSRGVAPT